MEGVRGVLRWGWAAPEGDGHRVAFPGCRGPGRNSALCLGGKADVTCRLLPTEPSFFSFSPVFHLPLQKPLVKDREAELLYFADVCAGPGGFSEYVLWRKKWHAKGFGMTLKGPNDFKLEDFYSASSELFEPYYGRDTEEGTRGHGTVLCGDIRLVAATVHLPCFLS